MKLHAVLKHVIIHTICNCLVLLLKRSLSRYFIPPSVSLLNTFSPSLHFCSVAQFFVLLDNWENSGPAKLKKKRKESSTYRIRQYTENVRVQLLHHRLVVILAPEFKNWRSRRIEVITIGMYYSQRNYHNISMTFNYSKW